MTREDLRYFNLIQLDSLLVLKLLQRVKNRLRLTILSVFFSFPFLWALVLFPSCKYSESPTLLIAFLPRFKARLNLLILIVGKEMENYGS